MDADTPDGAWHSPITAELVARAATRYAWPLLDGGRRLPDGATTPVTPPSPAPRSIRYDDMDVAPDGSWLAAVRERHTSDGVQNDVVAVPAAGGGAPEVLVDGSDFYATPRISPGGSTLSWLSWDQPDMPWDRTALATGRLRGGRVADAEVVAGGRDTSILQPAWSTSGVLHLVSDADGRGTLYRLAAGRLGRQAVPQRDRHGRRPRGTGGWSGGPTVQVMRNMRLSVQFWTARGFAVVAPNYGGSTGYGRAFRERLRGQWGIVDVADSVNLARWMVAEGLADRHQLAIRGPSAGGYTTLAALTQVDDFTAGVSLFGVTDLRLLAAETHKYEPRYLDGLLGDDPAVRSERSPIEHVARISAPLLILQGGLDTVVPPSQAEAMVARLDAAGSPYAYVTFPDERHGLRQAASIRRALGVELSFCGQVWGLTPADDVEAVEVHHLG